MQGWDARKFLGRAGPRSWRVGGGPALVAAPAARRRRSACPASSQSSGGGSGGGPHGLRVVLVHPQIPQNTGNVARTCAAAGVPLHVVGPLGFELSDKQLKRAGLDYWHQVCVQVHVSWEAFLQCFWDDPGPKRLVAFTVYASTYYAGPGFEYHPGDWLVFGAETTGLPPHAHDDVAASGGALLKIPISNAHVRSLNLAVSAGIGVFEALRQLAPHEVAPRDDTGLLPTVMMRHRQQQQQPQQQQPANCSSSMHSRL